MRAPAYHQAARSFGVMSAASVTGVILAMLPHVILAAWFGLGRVTDAYLMAGMVVQAVEKFLKFGVLDKVYISVLGRAEDARTADRITSNLLGINVVGLGVATLVTAGLAPYLVAVVAPGFDAATRELTTTCVRALTPTIVMMGVSELLAARLQHDRRFSSSAVIQLVVPAVSLVVMLATIGRLGIMGAVIGAVAGAALALVIRFVVLWRGGMRYRPVLDLKAPEVRSVARMMSSFYGFSLLTYAMGLVPAVLSTTLPAGATSALLYGMRMRSQVLATVLNVIPTIVYPSLARTVATGNVGASVDLIDRGIRFTSFVSMPILAALAVLSPDLVALLFQRGAFTADSLRDVTTVFAILMIGLLTAPMNIVYSRALYATQSTFALNLAKIVTGAVGLVMSVVLFRLFGLPGLAIATASQTSIELIVMYRGVAALAPMRATIVNASLARIVLATAGMIVLAFAAGEMLSAAGVGHETPARALRLAVGGLVAAGGYLGLVHWLGLREYGLARSLLRERLAARGA